MGFDLPARAPGRVARDPAPPALDGDQQRREDPAQAVEAGDVQRRDPGHRDQVVAVPQAFHIGLAEPDAAAQQLAVEARERISITAWSGRAGSTSPKQALPPSRSSSSPPRMPESSLMTSRRGAPAERHPRAQPVLGRGGQLALRSGALSRPARGTPSRPRAGMGEVLRARRRRRRAWAVDPGDDPDRQQRVAGQRRASRPGQLPSREREGGVEDRLAGAVGDAMWTARRSAGSVTRSS